jgi:DNA polymerase III subunit epsilon
MSKRRTNAGTVPSQILTARQWWAGDPLFLDTETTGLDDSAEVVEVSALDRAGAVVFESLVKPRYPIPLAATQIHLIGNPEVSAAPTFDRIAAELLRAIDGRAVVIYNAVYDTRLLRQSAAAVRIDWNPSARVHCAMLLYAKQRGGSWRRLADAAQQCGLDLPARLHRARADAELTRRLVQHLASLAEP